MMSGMSRTPTQSIAVAVRDYELDLDADGEHVAQTTYGTGRVCAHEGCATILTKYHEGDCCYIHDDAEYEPTEYAWWRCTGCGDNFPPDTSKRDARCLPCYRAHERERYARRIGREPTAGIGRKRKD